jgi:hypothetical protein
MMQIILYGSKGTAIAEFTDNQPGCLKLTFDGESGVESEVIDFEPETGRSVYGHGATVKRYMRHFRPPRGDQVASASTLVGERLTRFPL